MNSYDFRKEVKDLEPIAVCDERFPSTMDDFIAALKPKLDGPFGNRDVQFGVWSGEGYRPHRKVWVYDKVEHYAMGYIRVSEEQGYNKYDRSKSRPLYIVGSRLIKNGKGYDHRHENKSSNLKAAVGKALRGLHNYSLSDMAQVWFYDFKGKVAEEANSLRSKQKEVIGEILGTPMTSVDSSMFYQRPLAKLAYLMLDQIKEMDSELANKLLRVQQYDAEVEEANMYKQKSAFVFVTPTEYRCLFNVTQSPWGNATTLAENTRIISVTDKPALLSKLAVLAMLEPFDYEDGIGMKVDDNIFYIH